MRREDSGTITLTVGRRWLLVLSLVLLPALPLVACQRRPKTLVLDLAPGVTLELVEVPAGTFTMGSGDGDYMAEDKERPQHQVHLDAYYIGKTEVTVAQYRAFLQTSGHEGHSDALEGEDDHPAAYVSRDDAVAFCAWASEVTARELRLPTEAEWEKAARGTDGSLYPWGNEDPDQNLCNFNSNIDATHGMDTTTVGRFSPGGDSPYGCADMAGNVFEWTSSLYKGYPYDASDGREDASIPGARVLRGGSFASPGSYARAAFRYYNSPDLRNFHFGFRICASPI